MHPDRDLNVRVGGLGLGYTAQAVLAAERVAKVEAVTFYVAMVEEERTDWLFFGRNDVD